MFRYPHNLHECPVCGRPLRLPEEDLGRELTCPHCFGRFSAWERTGQAADRQSSPETLMDRAERLLRMFGEHQRAAPDAFLGVLLAPAPVPPRQDTPRTPK